MNLHESAELKNKEYRHGLVNAQIEVDLPLQIRALRKQLVGTQPQLSQLTGMKQPRISAMEKPGGAHFTLETLRRLAQAFDVALIVRFAPFSELVDWSNKFEPDSFRVPSFTEESGTQADEAEKVAEATRIEKLQRVADAFWYPLVAAKSLDQDRWADHMTLQTLAGLSNSNSVVQPSAGNILNSGKVRSITSSPNYMANLERKDVKTETIRYGEQTNTTMEQVRA